MNRRLLVLLIALCVLAGATPLPATTITLVCRMTGQPMPPILHEENAPQSKQNAPAEARMPCCIVHTNQQANGETHFALNERSCCDLRVTQQPAPVTALLSPRVSFIVALAPKPAAVVVFPQVDATGQPPLSSCPRAPRAPPPHFASLRAPPLS